MELPANKPRIVSFLILCIASLAAFGQPSTQIGFERVLLTQESRGWRVSILRTAKTESPFAAGDLVTNVDGRDASKLNALALAAFFSSSMVRSLPVALIRAGHAVSVTYYRGASPQPAYKAIPKPLRVTMGSNAPPFAFPTLEGKMMHLSDIHGKWILVNFWATWCAPCVAEIPVLKQLAAAHPTNLQVVGLAMAQDQSKISQEHQKIVNFIARVKPGYLILEGGDFSGQMVHDYGENNGMGSASIPYSILIRPDGTVAYVQCDFTDTTMLAQQVTEFLNAT